MRKRLLKIKWENISLIIFIPLAVIQFIQAQLGFKLISILISLTLYGGLYMTLLEIRHEALLNAKDEEEKLILIPIINYLYSYVYGFKSIKKEIIKQARYINDQAYILRASFKK